MSKYHGTRYAPRNHRNVILFLLAFALSLSCVSPASGQKEKKKKKKTDSSSNSKSLVSLTDEQQIDYTLSEMLGAWQLGDIEKLHSDYADDVAIVNGAWGPPILGWTNYLAIYQQQRTRMQQVRMDRTNTYIKVNGTVGWACYQWDFAAVVDGQQTGSQGLATVVLEKRNNHWVIVLNHTSLAQKMPQAAPPSAPAGQPQPDKPTTR